MNSAVDWRAGLEGKIAHHADEAYEKILPSVSLIRRLREHLALSQAEIAKILGVSQPNISKLEAGRDMRLSLLAKVVQAKGGDVRIIVDLPDGDSLELRP